MSGDTALAASTIARADVATPDQISAGIALLQTGIFNLTPDQLDEAIGQLDAINPALPALAVNAARPHQVLQPFAARRESPVSHAEVARFQADAHAAQADERRHIVAGVAAHF